MKTHVTNSFKHAPPGCALPLYSSMKTHVTIYIYSSMKTHVTNSFKHAPPGSVLRLQFSTGPQNVYYYMCPVCVCVCVCVRFKNVLRSGTKPQGQLRCYYTAPAV
jgi:hypothetical protein